MDDMKLLVTRADGVATLSLNRPERHNAVDDDLQEELERAWHDVVIDPTVRVVVLRGEGRSFCSGRDTSLLGERVAGESDLSFVGRHQLARLVQLTCPKPVIAAVQGAALGGGLEMALACDIRIAASDVQMAFPEIRYGLMTDTGGSPLATMLAGPSRAKLMLMTGRPIDAERALAWGLVDEVVALDELDARVSELAAELASMPVAALALIKQTVDDIGGGPLRTALHGELLAQVALFAGEDYQARKRQRTQGARDAHS
jgi:enoyl-CoA hydratase/carnithine racemase